MDTLLLTNTNEISCVGIGYNNYYFLARLVHRTHLCWVCMLAWDEEGNVSTNLNELLILNSAGRPILKNCYSLQEKKVFYVFHFCSSLVPSTRAWPWTGEIQGLCPASTFTSIWPRQTPKLVPALSILKLCGLRPTRYEMFKLFFIDSEMN